ncbi:hypothetical protein RCH06_002737 [Polaromonas sp. CG_9.5]|uniref:hypothetical protein n=1 Tax=Polaromonas sp. CG_9.5 TaxID=3071705 RepID=UPI002DF88B0D|nr:hypothetical protein [Polaromonas sp. CG_9.5]
MKLPSIPSFKEIKDYDQNRPGFAGEHWLVLGAGLALLLASRRSPSFLVRTAGSVVGSALVVRAASGSEGLSKIVRYLPINQGGLR